MQRRTFIVAGGATMLGGCVTGPDQSIATAAGDQADRQRSPGRLSQLGRSPSRV